MTLRTTQLVPLFGASALLIASFAGAQAQQVAAPPSVNGISDLSVKGPPVAGGSGQTVTPASSIANPADVGRRVRTHYKVFVPDVTGFARPNNGAARPAVAGGPPIPGYYAETPASLACIYGYASATPGCNPETLTASANTTGGSRAIALVDAYDNPSALTDLQTYTTQFGLPAITASNFQVVYASGSQPSGNTGWGLEEALDIEMAHAMAPNAKIYLVEAATNSFADLNAAVDVAINYVKAAGGGEVSMSYGGSEFSSETSYDFHFASQPGVSFYASTGDDPGTEYPSVSPGIVAVGGTNTSRRNDNRQAGQLGFFQFETAWNATGGGLSAYESAAPAQSVIADRLVTGMRGVPDISADASQYTRVWVACGVGCGYSSTNWLLVYGTSVASPLVAAMANNSGNFLSGSQEMAKIYSEIGSPNIYDVIRGTCGVYAGYSATPYSTALPSRQWDFCTGVGSPRGPGAL